MKQNKPFSCIFSALQSVVSRIFLAPCLLLLASCLMTSCSMTKGIDEGDQLFTGLEKIEYVGADESDNMITTQEEMEAALAAAPNGSLFGSSYYRLPFSMGVSIWNKYSKKESGFARWMTKSFGKQPVLMSWVNPELRANVGRNVLRNHGYFRGKVDYQVIQQKNPKEAKIKYTVTPGRLTYIDSIAYVGFPAEADSMIRSSLDEATIHRGDPFTVSAIDAERQRISQMLRNNGYYFYQPGFASYLADTLMVDGKAQLQLKLPKEVPNFTKHKWYIGRIEINMRKSFMEQYTDSFRGRFFTFHFSGKKPPIRPRVLLADMKLRPRKLYSYNDYLETTSKINAMGLFSMTEFKFVPRDTVGSDTLDLTLNCTFDKPWDFYVETNVNARTIGRIGPELKMGVTRRNAFRGAEKIDINVHGSYEWATSNGSTMNNYEYGADASVEFPRIIAPFISNRMFRRDKKTGRFRRRKMFFSTPTTMAKISADIIYRPSYYKMHVVSGEWTYRWQTSESSRHEFSPLTVKYQFMNSHTWQFEEIVKANPYLAVTMQDYFIPEMRYTYIYTSPAKKLHPIRWETTLTEAGNVVALFDMTTGKKWDDKEKKMFKNPYSQFLKVETDLTKTWTLNQQSKLVGRVNAGVIYAYGNSVSAPNSELFYVGGANSVRAFPVRGVGPGGFPGLDNSTMSYLVQNGDIKLVLNLEYRRQLFGDLYGAVFLDAGNVWNMRADSETDRNGTLVGDRQFSLKNLADQMALGTGIGIRYDLTFLVVRLDWGLGLHVPYDNGGSGYFNAKTFKADQTLHFAIGYPF